MTFVIDLGVETVQDSVVEIGDTVVSYVEVKWLAVVERNAVAVKEATIEFEIAVVGCRRLDDSIHLTGKGGIERAWY